MRRTLTTALAAMALVTGFSGTAHGAVDYGRFDQVLAEHERAVRERDLTGLEKTLTPGDSLTLILPNGVRSESRAAYLAFHRTFFASKTWTMRFEPVSQVVGQDLAQATVRSHFADVEDGKPVSGESWLTFTFAKKAGRWGLVHDQNTRVAASASP